MPSEFIHRTGSKPRKRRGMRGGRDRHPGTDATLVRPAIGLKILYSPHGEMQRWHHMTPPSTSLSPCPSPFKTD